MDFEKFVEKFTKLNARGVNFIVSYDGMTGDKTIALSYIYINAGLSAQATLNGKKEITYESLYISKNLKKF